MTKRIVRTETILLPLQYSCGRPRLDRAGQPIPIREDELSPVVIEVVEPEEISAAEAEAVRRRMAARAASIR